MGQIRLLFLLAREGSLPMGRIAEVFDLSSTAATGFVGRIERHGLVERRHRSDDRRVVECALTAVGERLLEELSGVRLDVIRSALSVLEPEELAEFRRLLRRIRERQAPLESPATAPASAPATALASAPATALASAPDSAPATAPASAPARPERPT